MKHYLPIALAALTLSAKAQIVDTTSYREHNVTCSFRAFSEGEERFKEKNNGGYNWSQDIEKTKIGNKQILELLVDEGVIDSISGWKIKALSTEGCDITGIFLVKKNQDPIDVSEFFSWDLDMDIQEYIQKVRFNKDDEERENTQYDYQGVGWFGCDFDELGWGGNCISECRNEYDFDDGKDDYPTTDITKRASFEGIVGYTDFGIFKGDVDLAKGKKTSLVVIVDPS